jgi:glyceraldehyde-3-phosphate dehydrogenase/erythrose-4-phosphate dehydrogenase
MDMTKISLAINGFGRIGRATFRLFRLLFANNNDLESGFRIVEF